MSKRSPFHSSQFGQSLAGPAEPDGNAQPERPEFFGDVQLKDIPTAERKARSREWEKKQKIVGYWGVPVELRTAVSGLAVQVGVRVDDVVRAFLEYGLDEYNNGRLPLAPVTNPHGRGKLTLYAEASGWGQKAGWRRETWNPKPRPVTPKSGSRKSRKKSRLAGETPDTCVLAVRGLPDELHQALLAVAENKAVPVGQIAIAFLKTSLAAFEAGALVLEPVTVATERRLFP